MIKAFRDTWELGIHSYLTYLRDRLLLSFDLLSDSGSIFFQIGDENVHRVRSIMEEVFGESNCVATIVVEKTSGASMRHIDQVADYVLWFAKDIQRLKFRSSLVEKSISDFSYEYKHIRRPGGYTDLENRYQEGRSSQDVFAVKPLTSQTNASTTRYDYSFRGATYQSGVRQWTTPIENMQRLEKAGRIEGRAASIGFVRFFDDYKGFLAPMCGLILAPAVLRIRKCMLYRREPRLLSAAH